MSISFNQASFTEDGEPTVVVHPTPLQDGRVALQEFPGGGVEQVGQVYPPIQEIGKAALTFRVYSLADAG